MVRALAHTLRHYKSSEPHLNENLRILDDEMEAEWELEADRREAELVEGTALIVPGHEAIARLRAKLSK